MNIRIKATNLTMSSAVSEYVGKRLDKVSRLVGGDPSIMCDVELSRTSGHHQKGEIFRAEIHIVGAGLDIYAAAEHEDLYSAVDDVRDEIIREFHAKKGKRISLIRRSGAQMKAMVKGIWPFNRK